MFNKGVNSVTAGALLTVSMRWTDRLIGFASTIILARILMPEDFGIIAMASLVVGLIDVLLALSVNVALIQNKNATQAHYDSAWTLRLAQTCLTGLIIFLLAPFAAGYFGDERISNVLKVMGVTLPLVGLENIGIITFQKEMRFGLDFRFVFCKRIAGFLVTMLMVWLIHSYWAMVIGTIAGRVVGVLISYQMHPMRPKLSLEKMGEIIVVSQWMLVKSIGLYLHQNLHKIIAGRRATAAIVGGYTLADEISAMPSTEVLAPINRVLFPAFVSAVDNPGELKRLFLLAQGVQSLIGIPVGVGLAIVAYEAVSVLLGEKWIFIVQFVQVLALAAVAESIATSAGYVLITLGKSRLTALLSWAQVVMFAIPALLLIAEPSLMQLAWLRLVAVAAGLFLSLGLLMGAMRNLSWIDLLRGISRPLLGAILMSYVTVSIFDNAQSGAAILLLAKMLLGAAVYTVSVFGMWYVSGRPVGAESYLLQKAAYLLKMAQTKILRTNTND